MRAIGGVVRVAACVVVSACLPRGHVDQREYGRGVGRPFDWASLGAVPAGHPVDLCREERRIETLPGVGTYEVHVPHRCASALIRVIALFGEEELDSWVGLVRWDQPIDSGREYVGFVRRDGGRVSIFWVEDDPGPVRIRTRRDLSGGISLEDWLPKDATRVRIRFESADGSGGGAGTGERAGAGSRQSGDGPGGVGRAVRAGASTRAGGREKGRRRAGSRAGGGHIEDGDRGGASSTAGAVSGAGDGRGGRGAPGRDGAGTNRRGTRAGSPRGGDRASCEQTPSAAIARRGGRVPGAHGVAGGSPAGRGQPGDRGLSMGMPIFGGLIAVPAGIASLLEVSSLLSSAGLSPVSLAKGWIQKAMRARGTAALRDAIANDAAEHAARAVTRARARLSRAGDFARMSAREQQRLMDATDDALRLEYFQRVERGVALEIEGLTRALTREARTEPQRFVHARLREELASAYRVKLAVKRARNRFQPKVESSAPAAATRQAGAAGPASARGAGPAHNAANAVRPRHQMASQQIAGGHAFSKHVVEGGEFVGLGIRTRRQFAAHIERIMNNPSATRSLQRGRTAYWDDATGTVVIRNPRAADGGTAFRPRQGRAYFEDVLQ